MVALQYRYTHAPPADVAHLDPRGPADISWERVHKGLDPIHVVY
jgi:hypothetical protein